MPFVFGLISGESTAISGLSSIDKLIKPVLIFILLLALILNNKWQTRSPVSGYVLALLALILILFSHLVVSPNTVDSMPAVKELARLSGFLIFIVCCSMVNLKDSDYRFLLFTLGLIALPIAVLSIHHSFTGDLDKSWKYVGGYLRAGSGILDANALAGLINLVSLCALGSFLIVKNASYKTYYFLAFVIGQAARFTTFSTGSFINILLALMVIVYMLRKYDAKNYKRVFKIGILSVFIIVGLMAYYGLFEAAFYRLTFSDDKVVDASVSSRLSQYEDLLSIVHERPSVLLIGAGNSEARELVRNGLEFHNAYLRPLLTTGLIGFIAFIFICIKSYTNYKKVIVKVSDAGASAVPYIIFYAAFIGWSFQAATIPADTSVIQWFYLILGYSLGNIIIKEKVAESKSSEIDSVYDNKLSLVKLR